MAGKNKEQAESSFQLDMTPMIDCTFNLLIFFLCNINFRLLEGKIPTFLPKDIGVNSSRAELPLEKLAIDLRRLAAPNVADPSWVWHEDQIDLRVQGRKQAGLGEFFRTLKGVREAFPDARATLHPGRGTLYVDCVKVINECLRANLVDVTFTGAPMDR
jgi:biopolymer transport protein ExbD